MSSLTVPPGCIGVELPNGQKVNADKNGHIQHNDPRFEKYALSTTGGQTGVITKTVTTFRAGASNFCTKCVFEGFAWQKVCPKCGADMIPEETT